MVDATFAFTFTKELPIKLSSRVPYYSEKQGDITFTVEVSDPTVIELISDKIVSQVHGRGGGQPINRILYIYIIGGRHLPLIKENDEVKVELHNIEENADIFTIGSLIISINGTSYVIPLPEKSKQTGWQLRIEYTAPAIAASGGASADPPEQFEPTYLKNKYGDCVIQCPECGNISGSALKIGTHTFSCSNNGKEPDLTERESKCASAPQMGGRRRTRRRHSRHRQSRRRRRRRQPTKLTALSRRAATPVR